MIIVFNVVVRKKTRHDISYVRQINAHKCFIWYLKSFNITIQKFGHFKQQQQRQLQQQQYQ